jgi:hypothetical protein
MGKDRARKQLVGVVGFYVICVDWKVRCRLEMCWWRLIARREKLKERWLAHRSVRRTAFVCVPEQIELLLIGRRQCLTIQRRILGWLVNNAPQTGPESRSQWRCGLRRRSAAACLLKLWFRIPPGTCCECCVLSGRGLCDEVITCPEESFRMWCVVVCDLETSGMRRPWPTEGRCAK